MFFHSQNLNDHRGGTQGSMLRHGRCWWHFGGCGSRVIQFSWNLLSRFCMIGFDIDDEDLTFKLAFPPVALWLSFSTNFWLVAKLAPRKVLSPQYPDTIVIDERECEIAIHSGCLWIHPWSKQNETVSADPWWVRGVCFHINPFEWKHVRHEVRCADYSRPEAPYTFWTPYVGPWERHNNPDGRETMQYPYRYVLHSGEIQERTATVYVERMAWRPRCLRWTSLFEKSRTSIDITFSGEVGERSGSWKGGCTGCSWELKPNETPLECLKRMEKDRVFA